MKFILVFLSLIPLIYAQCEDENAVGSCCRRNREVAILVAEGNWGNDEHQNFLQQVGLGILAAEQTAVAVVECGDGIWNGLTQNDDIVSNNLDLGNNNGNALGQCLNWGEGEFDDDGDKQVIVLITAANRESTDSPDFQATQIKAAGTEIFTVQLCDGLCDEQVAAELRAISSFPSDQHFVQLDSRMADAVASAVVGPLRGDTSVACSIFGQASHVVTFDGVAYDFQGKGEFWLVKSAAGNFDIQVRQEECVSNTQTTCSTGFAINDGSQELELRFIRETKRLVIYHDGELQLNQAHMEVSGYEISVVGRHIRDVDEDSDDREGWNVMVSLNNGGAFKVFFTANGAMAWVFPRPTDFGSLYGLCGYYDACPTNDWVGADLQPHEDAYSAAMTFNVIKDESFFRHTLAERYDFPDWEPLEHPPTNLDTAEELCGHLAGWLIDTCSFDVGAFGSNDAGSASAMMLYETCDLYCSLGTLPHGILDAYDCRHVCAPESAMGANLHETYDASNVDELVWLDGENTPEAIFRPSGNLGGMYTLQLNVTNLCDVSQRDVIINIECASGFPEDLDAGRRVEAELEPTGYPEVRLDASESAMEVFEASDNIREVLFSWTFVALPETVFWGDLPHLRQNHENGAQDIDVIDWDDFYDFLTQNDTWDALLASGVVNDPMDLTDDILREWWNVRSPHIRGNKSPTARFQPQSPGRHRLQFAASDGCQVANGEVNVIAHCPGCDPVASICQTYSQGSDDCVEESRDAIMWDGNGNGFLSAHFYAEDYFHESYGAGSEILTHQWWLEVMDREHRKVEVDDDQIDYVIQVVVGQPEMTDSDSGPANPQDVRTYDAPDQSSDPSYLSFLDPSDDEFGFVFHDFPPDLYLHAHRMWWSRRYYEVTETWESETYTEGAIEDHCTLRVTAHGGNDHVNDTDRVTVSVTNYADHPEDCEGDYTLHKSSWNTCKNDPDEIPLVVDCGPDPVPFISCVPSVYFDYFRREFPIVELDGRMSYDLNGVQLTHTWTVTGKPSQSEYLNLTIFRELNNWVFEGFGETTEVQVDNREGTYEITLTLDNGCKQHSATRTITTHCDPAPVAILTDDQGNQILQSPINLDPVEFDGSTASKQVQLDARDSYSADNHPIDTSLTYVNYPTVDWDLIEGTELETIISDNVQTQLNGNFLTFEAGYMRSEDGVDTGIFEVLMEVDDGCQIGSLTVNVQLTCESHVRAKTGAADTLFLDSNGGRVYLTSSASRHILNNNALDPNNFVVTYQWVFLNWPGMEDGDPAPNLEDQSVNVYRNETAFNTFGNQIFIPPDQPGSLLYDPILNRNPENNAGPFGSDVSINIVPDDYDGGSYENGNLFYSQNPAPYSDATSFLAPVVGDYRLKLVAWDDCKYDGTTEDTCDANDLDCAQHVIIQVRCEGFVDPTAEVYDLNGDFVDTNPQQQYTVEIGTDIDLWGIDENTQPNSLNIEYEWIVVSAPEGSDCYDPDPNNGPCRLEDIFPNQFGNSPDNSHMAENVMFNPDTDGIWEIEFVNTAEICGEKFVELTMNVICSNEVVTISNPQNSAANDIVTWTDNKFEKIDVTASHLPLPQLDFEFDVEYWWVVTRAPADSYYAPQCYDRDNSEGDPSAGDCQFVTNYNDTDTNTTFNDDGTYTNFVILSDTVEVEEYFSFVQLAPFQPVGRYEEYDRFLGCIFPDVPGIYEIQLNVAIQCGVSVPQYTQFQAQCNAAPVVSAVCSNCEDDAVTLTGSKYARVQLDGSASSDANAQQVSGEVGDRVTYWWDWAVQEVPDEWTEWVEENVVILNRNQARASFLVKRAGIYEVTLYVNDGCTENSQTLIIEATCDNNLNLGDDGRKDVSIGYLEVSAVSLLEFDLSEFIDPPYCAQEYTWEVVDYSKDAESVPVPSPSPDPKTPKESSAFSIHSNNVFGLFIGLFMAVFAYHM